MAFCERLVDFLVNLTWSVFHFHEQFSHYSFLSSTEIHKCVRKLRKLDQDSARSHLIKRSKITQVSSFTTRPLRSILSACPTNLRLRGLNFRFRWRYSAAIKTNGNTNLWWRHQGTCVRQWDLQSGWSKTLMSKSHFARSTGTQICDEGTWERAHDHVSTNVVSSAVHNPTIQVWAS